MPTIINPNGGTKWYQGEQKPATHVGNPRTQRDSLEVRQKRTIASTSRSINMFKKGIITEKELEEAIGRNAATVEMWILMS